MAGKDERLLHELAAYEVALRKRERKRVSEELERYKRNLQALMPTEYNENPPPCDFPGCIE